MEIDAVPNAIVAQDDNRRKDAASDLKKKKSRFFRLPFWKNSKSKTCTASEVEAHARVVSELASIPALNVWDYMTPISSDTDARVDAPHFVWSKEATYEYASQMSSNARRAVGMMVANPPPYRNWDYDDSSDDSFDDARPVCFPFRSSRHHSICLSDRNDTSNAILFRNSVASLLSELLNPRFTQVTYHSPSSSRHDWTIECVFSDASKLWVASLSILDYETHCCVFIKSLNDEANWTSASYRRRIHVWNDLCHALYLNGPFEASNKDDAESASCHFDTYVVTFGEGRPNPNRYCSNVETRDAQIIFNDKTISTASCQSIDSLKLLMQAITEHLPRCAELDAFKLLMRVTSMPSHFPWMRHLFGRSSSLSSESDDGKESLAITPSSSFSPHSRDDNRTRFAFDFAAGCVSPIVDSSHCSRYELDYRVLFAPNGIYCVGRGSTLSCFSMEDGSLHARFIMSRDEPTEALLVKSRSHPRLEGTTVSLNDGDSKTCRRLKVDRLIAMLKHVPKPLMMIDPHCLQINIESTLKIADSKQAKSGGLIVQQDNKFVAPFLSLEHASCHQIRALPTPSATRCEHDGLSALWYYHDHIILLWCHTVNRFAYVCILSLEAKKNVTKSNYFDRDVMSFSYTQLKPRSTSVASKRVDFRPGTRLSPTIVTNGFADQSQSQAIVIQFTTKRKDGGAGFESEEVFTFNCNVIQCGGRSEQLNAARFTRNAGLRLWLGNVATSPSNKSTLPSKGGKGSNAGWHQLLQVATDAPDGKLRETGFFAYKACVATDTEKPCIVTLFVPPTAMVSNWLTNEPKKRFSDVLVMSIDRIPILADGTLDGTFKPDMPPILKSVEAMMSRSNDDDAPLSDAKIAIMCIVCGKDEAQLRTGNKDTTWMRHQPCGHVCCVDCHVLCMASLKWGSILPKCPVCSKSVNSCAALEKRELMPTDFLLKWQPPREGQLLCARSIHNPTFMYRVGASIHIADFDTDLTKVCSAGVHAFVGDTHGECFRHVIEYGATNSNPKMGVSFPKETTKADEKAKQKTKPAAASSSAYPSSSSPIALPSTLAESHSLASDANIQGVSMPGFSVSTAKDQSKQKDEKQKKAKEPVASSSSTPDVATSSSSPKDAGLKKDKKQKKAKVAYADEHSSSPLVAQYSAVSSSRPVDHAVAPFDDRWAVWSDEEGVEDTRPEALNTQSSRAITPSSSDVGLALWHQRDASSTDNVRTIYPSLEHWTEKPNTTLTSDSIASSSKIVTPVSAVHVHAGATGPYDVSDAMHDSAPQHLVADVLLRNAIATQPEMRHLTSTTEEDLIRWDEAIEWDTSQRLPPFNRVIDLPLASAPLPSSSTSSSYSAPSSNNLSIIDTFGASFPSVPAKPVPVGAERSSQSKDKATPSASLI